MVEVMGISMISRLAEEIYKTVEWAVDKALLDFASKQTRDVLTSRVWNLRGEPEKTVNGMKTHVIRILVEAIATMGAEAVTRASAKLCCKHFSRSFLE
jgi:hypothetical protein